MFKIYKNIQIVYIERFLTKNQIYFGDINKNTGKNRAELIIKLIKSNIYGKILA